MYFLYNIGIFLYGLLLRFASLFNPKAKKWVNGRKNWKQQLVRAIPKNKDVFWFHCASLGEFEQGKPIIEGLKNKYPDYFILITFFSPSGYEIRKNYEKADYVCYLPLDSIINTRYFVNIAKPKAAFFIKYEFWANYLFQLKKQHIPIYSISSLFRENQYFFKRTNYFSRKVLASFSHFYVQNEESKKLLNSINFNNVTISGDTRYDRVADTKDQLKENIILSHFTENHATLIVGSSWAIDEKLLLPLINNVAITERVIIAPHEIDEVHINAIQTNLHVTCLRYSECDETTDFQNCQVLIIDNIGLLSSAYFYGDYAYVGGGFGKGLHNILEPAVFGLPVIFGSQHTKHPEAKDFIEAGIAFSINNQEEFLITRKSILNSIETLKYRSQQFMESKKGAREIILNDL